VKASDISFREASRLVLKRRLDEVFSHAASLEPGAHNEEQHELRKSLRRVRYTLETMSVSYDKPIKSYVKTLVGLQDTLGEMQDIAVLLETTKRVFKGDVPEDVRLFNEYGDRKRAELLEETRAAWSKAKAKGLWDELRALHLQLPTVVQGL
jgi:CHAD domain-containing protein